MKNKEIFIKFILPLLLTMSLLAIVKILIVDKFHNRFVRDKLRTFRQEKLHQNPLQLANKIPLKRPMTDC